MRKPPFATLAAVLIVAALAAACGGTRTAEVAEATATPELRFPGANVILISIDTLRADRMSLYGYHRPTTPNLEEFARDAIVFDSFFYNGGGTLPSHMSMMTSLHPATHGITPETGQSLQPERITLAEELAAAGYSTAGVVDGGWLGGKFGFEQGFDLYDDLGGRFEKILPRANYWLDHHFEEKFFLFIHTYDVHSENNILPYECPGDYHMRYAADMDVDFDGCRQGECATRLINWVNAGVLRGQHKGSDIFTPQEIDYISALYDGCINYVDDRLGELFARLKELGVYDDSLIIVISDHGEEFLEHGMLGHDHGGYEELAHIPLIIKLPGSVHGGERAHFLAAMVDLMPTVLRAVGLEVPDQAQGHDLMWAVEKQAAVRDSVHMYEVLRTERFKYFLTPERLFDLSEDPAEHTNLRAGEPTLRRFMSFRLGELLGLDNALYDEFRKSVGEAERVELSAEEQEQLRALGYLQ